MDTFDLILYIISSSISIGLAVLGGTVSSTKPWHRKAFVGLGVASVVIIVAIGVKSFRHSKSEEREAAQAKEQAQRDIDQIKQQLTDSELKRSSDTRYLEGKLEVFGQFAPAVLELARASELNTRKQYEQKVLSNKELRDFVTAVVKKMRDWQIREDQAEAETRNKYFAALSEIYAAHAGEDMRSPQIQQQLTKLFNDNNAAEEEIYRRFRWEFSQTILGEAVNARDQLISKLGVSAEPLTDALSRSTLFVFQGIIAGPHPVEDAAGYLERFAEKLSP